MSDRTMETAAAILAATEKAGAVPADHVVVVVVVGPENGLAVAANRNAPRVQLAAILETAAEATANREPATEITRCDCPSCTKERVNHVH